MKEIELKKLPKELQIKINNALNCCPNVVKTKRKLKEIERKIQSEITWAYDAGKIREYFFVKITGDINDKNIVNYKLYSTS